MDMTETGKTIHQVHYSRGGTETWEETVQRVVDGNLALVGPSCIEDDEREQLVRMMTEGKIIPAGRHLAMSGVEGRQFLFNCHVAGWDGKLSDHFEFTFMRLMEGGGVGSNYSNKIIQPVRYRHHVYNLVRVMLYCDSSHPDYEELKPYLQPGIHMGIPRNNMYHYVDDSREGWAWSLRTVIDAGTGNTNVGDRAVDRSADVTTVTLTFDLSRVRSSGSPINTFGGTAAGPVPLAKLLKETENIINEMWLNGVDAINCMQLDHKIAQCVISGNVRRSARMSIMHWDDPQIDWFLSCKADHMDHWSTNISVEIDDEFIGLLDYGFDKTNLFTTYEPVNEYENEACKAGMIWNAICEGMLKNGEPGFWNSSLANVGENPETPAIATNPCGEIGLSAWENCCLGHINLAAFLDETNPEEFDFEEMVLAHRLMTRFLVRATWGDVADPKQRMIVDRNRRIGVGHLGYQWFVNGLGIRYSDSHKSDRITYILQCMRSVVDSNAQIYASRLRIPAPIKTTTVAPTGTIGKLFGVSEGIHPIYAKYFIRRIRLSAVDPDQIRKADEYRKNGFNVIPDVYQPNTVVVEIPTKDPILDRIKNGTVESVDQININDMLSVQEMYQRHYANNSVSFTVNTPEGVLTPEALGSALRGHLRGLKGTTLMVDGSRPLAPYERIDMATYYDLLDAMSGDTESDSYGDGGCASGACPVR
jgi:ribonucleoside-triphosphate reductase